MDKKYESGSKAKAFLKRNMYYFIIGACIIAIGAMVAVALLVKNDDTTPTGEQMQDTPAVVDQITDTNPSPVVDQDPNNTTPVVEPEPEPIIFTAPVAGGSVSKDYNMSTVVYWSTLKHYAVHNGVDFSGDTGAAALAAFDGKVANITYDALNGNVVKIDHGNGLVTTYGSLDNIAVTEGQTVAKGEALGTISTSATNEMLDGAHVHFCVYENGNIIDPYEYLPSLDK